MSNAKQIGLALLLLLIIIYCSCIYCEETLQPMYTIIPIKNKINLINRTAAKYIIRIYNPTNITFKKVYLYSISGDWYMNFNPSYFELKPKQTVQINVTLYPLYPNVRSTAAFAIVYANNKKIVQQISLNPIIVRKVSVSKTSGKMYAFVKVDRKNVEPGDILYILVTIGNLYKEKRFVNIYIKSDILPYPVLYSTIVNPGKEKTVIIPVKTSEIILPGNYTIEIRIKSKNFYMVFYKNVSVIAKKLNIIVYSKNNLFVIKNNGSRAVYYTYKVPVSFLDKLFYTYKPAPAYEIKEQNNDFYVWNIILLPNESIEITKGLNYRNIAIFAMLIVLTIIYFYLYYLTPRVHVKKEIARIDHKNKKIKFIVTLKNNSFYELRGIKIKDQLLSLFKFEGYEFIEPVNHYIKEDKLIIDWYIEELAPKEERIFTYTVSYDTEIIGEISLDPVVVEFKIFGRKWKFKSNRIILKFV